jgi:hypothetical protein
MTTLLPPNVKVHLALGFIDMRKGIDGLSARSGLSRWAARTTCSPDPTAGPTAGPRFVPSSPPPSSTTASQSRLNWCVRDRTDKKGELVLISRG